MTTRWERRRTSAPRATRALVALGAVVALALASCSADGQDGPGETSGDPTASAPRATWPLTGLRVRGPAAGVERPVLVVKIDNTASSAPQLGLSAADLVVEETVEGGVTRLAVFYQSEIPGVVGPVRSMRASDIGIVSPVGATVVTSGAAQQTILRLARAEVPYVTEGSAGFFREPTRGAPYNLMADLGDVADALTTEPVQAPAYLPFGPVSSLPAGDPATSFDARFSGAHTTSWTFQQGAYVDTGSLAAAGEEFSADSVLVLRVRLGDAGYLDPAGNTVPETKLVGTGEAQLFHGGRVVTGTWSKSTLGAPLSLSTQSPTGEQVALQVPPGHTWIELVPLSGGVDVSP